MGLELCAMHWYPQQEMSLLKWLLYGKNTAYKLPSGIAPTSSQEPSHLYHKSSRQVSETGAKNQGEPTVSVGSIRVECLIIRPLCVNVGNMLSPRYPDTAGAMSLSAGSIFSRGGGAPLILPLAEPEGKKQERLIKQIYTFTSGTPATHWKAPECAEHWKSGPSLHWEQVNKTNVFNFRQQKWKLFKIS